MSTSTDEANRREVRRELLLALLRKQSPITIRELVVAGFSHTLWLIVEGYLDGRHGDFQLTITPEMHHRFIAALEAANRRCAAICGHAGAEQN